MPSKWHIWKSGNTITYTLNIDGMKLEELRQAMGEIKFMKGEERVYINAFGELVVEVPR